MPNWLRPFYSSCKTFFLSWMKRTGTGRKKKFVREPAVCGSLQQTIGLILTQETTRLLRCLSLLLISDFHFTLTTSGEKKVYSN